MVGSSGKAEWDVASSEARLDGSGTSAAGCAYPNRLLMISVVKLPWCELVGLVVVDCFNKAKLFD